MGAGERAGVGEGEGEGEAHLYWKPSGLVLKSRKKPASKLPLCSAQSPAAGAAGGGRCATAEAGRGTSAECCGAGRVPVSQSACVCDDSLAWTRVRGLLCFHLRLRRRHLRPTGTPASSGLARASAGNCAPQAAAAPASSAARRPHEDATRSVAAAAGTARGCAHGVRNALALAAKSTAIEKLRMVNEGWGGNGGPRCVRFLDPCMVASERRLGETCEGL